MKPLLLLLVLLLVIPLHPVQGQLSKSDHLRKTIREEQKQVERQQEILEQLTSKERQLYRNLAEIEDRMRTLQTKLQKQQQKLREIEIREGELQKEFARISHKKEQTSSNLEELLTGLWPVHVTDLQSRIYALSSWSEADRQFTWMASIYAQVQDGLHTLERQTETLAANLQEQEQIKTEIQSELADVESTKDSLLSEKLSFLRQVQEVRARKLEQEEQLHAVLSTVESMEFELHTLTDRSFRGLQGHLPWPGHGKVVASFNPGAAPPVRGIGIEVDRKQPVQAVSWGKVVHNDQLRGFGRVVILYHGDDYYTLYAFLANSPLRMGQKVEKGESIGTTGFYPPANGPGLYFELRFGQKAVNPMDWLASSG